MPASIYRTLAGALLCAGACTPARAQDPLRITASQQNLWANYFGNHAVSRRWGLHLEGQWRREGLGERWMQLLLRSGVNCYLAPGVTLTGGYAFVKTSPYGEYPVAATFPEHRIWQQALVQHKLGRRTAMQHRYRLEQRFIGQVRLAPEQEPRRDSWRYENRFRYMARADIPLSQKEGRPDWHLTVYDEILINFGGNVAANVFDQNRAYIALGKTVSPSMRLEVGYMNQLLQQRNGRIFENNHTLMVSVFSSFAFRNAR